MQPKAQYQEITYTAPYRGINAQNPEDAMPQSDCLIADNVIFRNDEIKSAPKYKRLFSAPDAATKGLGSFIDENNVMHTVAITKNDVYQLIYTDRDKTREPKWIWAKISPFSTAGPNNTYNTLSLLNKFYWTTNYPGVYYWDGLGNLVGEVTQGAGTVPLYGGSFFGELGFHLILLNTAEYNTVTKVVEYFPQRVRWSANGIPTAWEASVNPNAGYTDQFDVPDIITGFLTIGKVGFIFRSNGITQMTLTGQGNKPFIFDHLWASDRGIGNIYSRSIASYGSVGMFVSFEQIYMMSVSSFKPIGGEARDAILTDLADAQGQIIATILPGYDKRFIYPTYNLFVPQKNGTKIWQYSIEDENWTNRYLDGVYVIGEPKLGVIR